MNKKGFTLVELLAVILVISIVTLIALPQVLNQFSNYTEKLEAKEEEMIIEAGRTYVELNQNSFNTSKCVNLKTLVDAELLNEKLVKDSLGNSYNTQYKLKVVKNTNGYTITLVDAGAC